MHGTAIHQTVGRQKHHKYSDQTGNVSTEIRWKIRPKMVVLLDNS